MTPQQARDELVRHQPTCNGITFEDDCAVCGHRIPCPTRLEAEEVLAIHHGARLPDMRDGQGQE
jgi:hypothetical protein